MNKIKAEVAQNAVRLDACRQRVVREKITVKLTTVIADVT